MTGKGFPRPAKKHRGLAGFSYFAVRVFWGVLAGACQRHGVGGFATIIIIMTI